MRCTRVKSSITYALQQLESQLGVRAFRIDGRKAVLTPTGQLLYRRARYLLDEAAQLERSAQRLSAGWEAELRVAVEVLYPTWLLLGCLNRYGRDDPDTRIEVIESVYRPPHRHVAEGATDSGDLRPKRPAGFTGEPLMRLRFILVAHPDHPLHKLRRKLSMRDLRPYRHLLVRETSPDRSHVPPIDDTRRWTVSDMGTSIEAARSGYGFAFLPEYKILNELRAGTLKALPMDGAERHAQLYLIFADGEHAGPGAQRLAEVIREQTAHECTQQVNVNGARKRAAKRSASTKRQNRLISEFETKDERKRRHVKKAAKKKVEPDKSGTSSVMRSVFRSFAKLAEQAGDGRPLLRGLRVAQDPTADRIVIVHGGSRIEFVLVLAPATRHTRTSSAGEWIRPEQLRRRHSQVFSSMRQAMCRSPACPNW